MTEFAVRLVPVTGGYALHRDHCDCPDSETPGRSRIMTAASVHAALARFHAERSAGLAQPARIARRACAANVPMNDPEPMSWQERHGHYMREAACTIHSYTEHMVTVCDTGGARIEGSRFDEDGHRVPLWRPERDHIRVQVGNAYSAERLLLCVRGVKDPRAGAERLIAQTEEVYRREMEWLATDTVQYGDALDRAYAVLERATAVQITGWLRFVLSPVIAHRMLRDPAE